MKDRVYEVLFIADPNLGEPEVDALTATVQGFVEKPRTSAELHSVRTEPAWIDQHGIESRGRDCLASMGIYAFTADALAAWLNEARPDFGADVLPAMVAGGAKVMAHRFRGYWQDVGTLPAYFDANMALLAPKPELDLYERDWLILTRSEERAPARIGADARVEQSMISHGCVIEGIVERSVLSPGVHVGRGAIVRDSIVMFDAVIGPGAVIDHAIIDKEVHIGRDAKVGVGELPGAPNRANPEMLATGLVVINFR